MVGTKSYNFLFRPSLLNAIRGIHYAWTNCEKKKKNCGRSLLKNENRWFCFLSFLFPLHFFFGWVLLFIAFSLVQYAPHTTYADKSCRFAFPISNRVWLWLLLCFVIWAAPYLGPCISTKCTAKEWTSLQDYTYLFQEILPF